MGVFPRLAALALGLVACAGDVPGTELAPSATQAACQRLAHWCPRGAVEPLLDQSVCLSLTVNRNPEYAVCWPATTPAGGSSRSRSGGLVLAAFREDSRPCMRSSCGGGHYCVCLNAGGDAPAWALTFALPHPPGLHATGCLILWTPTPSPAASHRVTLRL